MRRIDGDNGTEETTEFVIGIDGSCHRNNLINREVESDLGFVKRSHLSLSL